MATPRQIELVKTLVNERADMYDTLGMPGAALKMRVFITEGYDFDILPQGAIGDLIASNRELKKTLPKTTPAKEKVPAGHYAILFDGVTKFFRVDKPDKGKWAGYTFVKEQASDEYYPVRGQRQRNVLAEIEKDPRAAAIAYGRELGRCSICNRTLTDPDSIANGIGPVCATRF